VMADWGDESPVEIVRERLATALGKCAQAYEHLPFAEKADFASLAKDILLKDRVLSNLVRQKAGLTAADLFANLDETYPAIRQMTPSFAALIAPAVELPPLPTVEKPVSAPIIAPVSERVIAPAPESNMDFNHSNDNDWDWNSIFVVEGFGLAAALIADRPIQLRDILVGLVVILLLNWAAYWFLYKRQPSVIQQVMSKFKKNI
jgi:hypothetical protein